MSKIARSRLFVFLGGAALMVLGAMYSPKQEPMPDWVKPVILFGFTLIFASIIAIPWFEDEVKKVTIGTAAFLTNYEIPAFMKIGEEYLVSARGEDQIGNSGPGNWYRLKRLPYGPVFFVETLHEMRFSTGTKFVVWQQVTNKKPGKTEVEFLFRQV